LSTWTTRRDREPTFLAASSAKEEATLQKWTTRGTQVVEGEHLRLTTDYAKTTAVKRYANTIRFSKKSTRGTPVTPKPIRASGQRRSEAWKLIESLARLIAAVPNYDPQVEVQDLAFSIHS
jgi:hypothetical protein